MRSSVEEAPEHCAIEFAMEMLGGRWKLAILKQLATDTHRFGELRRALPGITQRMLTRQLRELEADSLVTRTVYREVPPRVEYALTEVGHSLDAITEELDKWGRWYRETVRPEGPAGRRPPAGPGPTAARRGVTVSYTPHCGTNGVRAAAPRSTRAGRCSPRAVPTGRRTGRTPG